jgi:hypothetical protein
MQGICLKNYVPPLVANIRPQETLFDDHDCVFIPDILPPRDGSDSLQRMPGIQWINMGIKRLVSSSNAMNRKMISSLPVFLEER